MLAAHPDVEQAIVYGSRAMGRQRPASDIDLTLIGAAIGFGTLARIEAELDDAAALDDRSVGPGRSEPSAAAMGQAEPMRR